MKEYTWIVIATEEQQGARRTSVTMSYIGRTLEVPDLDYYHGDIPIEKTLNVVLRDLADKLVVPCGFCDKVGCWGECNSGI